MWRSLDVEGPPTVGWPRRAPSGPAVVLLGAFDPPTNAHVAIARAASTLNGRAAVWCLTKTLLARDEQRLLTDEQRLGVLDAIAERTSGHLALANRGTYLEVHRAFDAQGIVASFVIGSDKLAQLADPAFYPDGPSGVDATFSEVAFIVVPRPGSPIDRNDVPVLEASEVFADAQTQALSATNVRARLDRGTRIDHLVPPEVISAIEGYTAAR